MPKTQPTYQKLTNDKWGKDQKLGGSKGLGGSARRAGISLAARLGKQGLARLEEFRLTNTVQARLGHGTGAQLN